MAKSNTPRRRRRRRNIVVIIIISISSISIITSVRVSVGVRALPPYIFCSVDSEKDE
jgi:hypothetical protein